MHSRKRGVSGSTKPAVKTPPTWVKYKPKEIEMLVAKYAKEGLTPSEIGIHLRDTYGVPDVKLMTKKTITAILEEKKLTKELPEDLMALIKKSVMVREHLGENHKDETAKRGLILTESKIKRLIKYYKGNGRLAADWKYDATRLKMYLD